MDCPVDSGALADETEESDYEIHPVDVSFSDLAITRLQEIMEMEGENVVLKVAVHRGGCSGYLYDMQVVEKPDDGEHQHSMVDGIPVAVSNFDSSLLSGITIDFENSLMGGGFKIENPNANKGCSCGKSFA